MNNAYLSIVEPPRAKGGNLTKQLLVRARAPGHIQAIFPKANVLLDKGTDYRFRAYIPRQVVADAIARQVSQIDYPNFKDSVRNNAYHDALFAVWRAMMALQNKLRPAGQKGRLPLYERMEHGDVGHYRRGEELENDQADAFPDWEPHATREDESDAEFEAWLKGKPKY
jgi:acetyl esterase/lipase